MVSVETVLGNTVVVEKRINVWPLIQKRTKCIRHLALFINLLNSANLSFISQVTLILTIRLTVQYRDKYLRQGKNHHKNKNELLLLGHNLKIALLSLTRFSLDKRKNPSWKVLDVGLPPLSSPMGFVIFFQPYLCLRWVNLWRNFYLLLNFTKETSKCFLWWREGNKDYFRDLATFTSKFSKKSQFWSNLKQNIIWVFLSQMCLKRGV